LVSSLRGKGEKKEGGLFFPPQAEKKKKEICSFVEEYTLFEEKEKRKSGF